MKILSVNAACIFFVIACLLLEDSSAWFGRRRRRSKRPSSFNGYVNNKGYGGSYTWGNGWKVSGGGNWKGGWQVGISKTWGKRELKFTPEAPRDANGCKTCVHILPMSQSELEKTKLTNDAVLVLIVKFKSEVESKCKKDTLIKFEIKKVFRSPTKSMKPGMFFTLDAIKTNCPCLPMLKPGTYTLFGFYNEQRQLEISGALLKIVPG